MKILCLFVRHGTEQHAEAKATLDTWYDRQGLTAQRTLWIIDNALPADAPAQVLPDGSRLLAGDNQAWEFSAWARTLRRPELKGEQFDVVHCVTSAFNTLYTRYLEHFQPNLLTAVVARQFCLGHIDSYDRAVTFAGHQSAEWIRTCFFFLPFSRAITWQHWCAFTDPAQIFRQPDSTEFRADAPLSLDYQNRIRTWLEGQEVGGHTWHSPIGQSPAEVQRFQRKTLAILNEHSLAAHFRAQGLPLVDFCWLYTLSRGANHLPETLPPESDQLKVRRQVLGIPEPLG